MITKFQFNCHWCFKKKVTWAADARSIRWHQPCSRAGSARHRRLARGADCLPRAHALRTIAAARTTPATRETGVSHLLHKYITPMLPNHKVDRTHETLNRKKLYLSNLLLFHVTQSLIVSSSSWLWWWWISVIKAEFVNVCVFVAISRWNTIWYPKTPTVYQTHIKI